MSSDVCGRLFWSAENPPLIILISIKKNVSFSLENQHLHRAGFEPFSESFQISCEKKKQMIFRLFLMFY